MQILFEDGLLTVKGARKEPNTEAGPPVLPIAVYVEGVDHVSGRRPHAWLTEA